jgi:hypothetical protein
VDSMYTLDQLSRREVWDGVTARLVDGERMTLAIVEIAPGECPSTPTTTSRSDSSSKDR